MKPMEFGKIDVGEFEADIRFKDGVWQFLPHYSHAPKSGTALLMNAMIRSVGRVWTPIPEDEIPKVKAVLREKGFIVA